MSAEKLISTMEKLLKLHQSLYEIALKKTDIVKNGDIDALNQTMKDEQTHIAAISRLEKERRKITSEMVPGKEKPTIEDCLKGMNGTSFEALERLRSEILDIITKITKRNELNQMLIYQSLQFVNFSINLLIPQQENFNYGPKVGKNFQQRNFTGLFNSQA